LSRSLRVEGARWSDRPANGFTGWLPAVGTGFRASAIRSVSGTFKYAATVQKVTDETCQIPTFTAHEVVRRVVVNYRISIRRSSTFRDRPPPCRLTRSGELSDADACANPSDGARFK
jgi:hypothetical protein